MASASPESLPPRVAQRPSDNLESTRPNRLRYDSLTDGSYRPLLDAAPDAIVVVNDRREIILLNAQAERQFGYPRAALVGRQITDIIPDGSAGWLAAYDRRSSADAPARETNSAIELTGRRQDGSAFPSEIMVSTIETTGGVVVALGIRDITSRRHTAEQLRGSVEELRRSNEDLRQFAHVASHDLQEPLRTVTSFLQLLATRYKGRLGIDADQFIAFAVDGANRMRNLIDDLLAYSKIGASGSHRVHHSAEEALQHAVSNLGPAIHDSGTQVTHDPLPEILADKGQMTQLFQNLLGNAIKYRSTAPPQIHVSAAKTGADDWTFSIRDNGLGIQAQHLETIFGVFRRLHTQEEFPGTGIGLAICKKIVERHGGHISCESEPGHGSTFRFCLSGEARPSP